MKKLLLLLPFLCLSGQVLAKVSYEDAIESNRPYHDANGAVHIPPDTKGLGPDEFDPDATESTGENEMGVWVYENRYASLESYRANRVLIGDSDSMARSQVTGKACLKGLKGYYAELHGSDGSGLYYQYSCN